MKYLLLLWFPLLCQGQFINETNLSNKVTFPLTWSIYPIVDIDNNRTNLVFDTGIVYGLTIFRDGSLYATCFQGVVGTSNLIGAITLRTNTGAFNFFPNNPGNWVTALNTRTTNGVRRATLEVDISFVDAVGATPRVQFAIEQGTVITNVWQCGIPGGIASTITNHYSFRLTTNAVVNITDISVGAGASVAISQSQLTSE